ncbi:hypothetical protein ISF_03290 [Cordyceps fumosorosea ARSEF 2679]|uniref:Uncharacterized protein n=1 Tax=Cordyceps fumosorosea (strain ARSEF 2679) TaxID=1081104 RepID=A0A168ALN3_CORFA|nr:hypothetical protein ISF_03290 [Cordyceps fumosorosea ARSEF 2679]OAA68915.1 hypothetical protein ISF_03290 [Cordyceps fumosorosea ARSEF 2679]
MQVSRANIKQASHQRQHQKRSTPPSIRRHAERYWRDNRRDGRQHRLDLLNSHELLHHGQRAVAALIVSRVCEAAAAADGGAAQVLGGQRCQQRGGAPGPATATTDASLWRLWMRSSGLRSEWVARDMPGRGFAGNQKLS